MNVSTPSSVFRFSQPTALLLNFVGFQVGWFACVLGASDGFWWIGPAVVFLLALAHAQARKDWKIDLAVLSLAMIIGFIGDSFLALAGVIHFQTNPFPFWLSPPWMIVMWANFALTLRSSLNWLLKRYLLGATLGAVGGPLAYYAGERLGAIEFTLALPAALLVLAIFWGTVVPLLLFAASAGESRWK